MTEAGFFAQKTRSPTSLVMVIALHVAVFAAVVLIKGPQFIRIERPPTAITFIEPNPDPPPVVQPPQPNQPVESVIDRSIVIADRPPLPGPITDPNPVRPPIFGTEVGGGTVTEVGPTLPPLPAVRRGAELDPRYSGQLQPTYPPSELRAQRDGRVQVRVTIGPNGRVTSVARLMATSDAFWRVTEQQALNRWRFRPATLDGRPVEDSKVMTLVFRIVDQG